MNTFHIILQRFVVSLFALCFVFVAVYVPQPWNETKKAEAVVWAQEHTQLLNLVALGKIVTATAATAVATKVTADATINLKVKETILDGIAWTIAKRIVAQMTVSIVNWINI